MQACAGNEGTVCSGWTDTKEVAVLRLAVNPNPGPTGSHIVSWPSVAHATHYRLQERIGEGAWDNVQEGTARSRQYEGRSVGTYAYRFAPRVAGIWRSWSDPVSHAVVASTLAPPQIAGPERDTDGRYRLTWMAATGASRYVLQERRDDGAWRVLQDRSATTRSVRGRVPGIHAYRVGACTPGACSDWSTVKEVRVPPPMPFTVLGPSTSSGGFDLQWPVVTGASHYVLEEHDDDGIWVTVSDDALNPIRITKERSGVYTYRVKACNHADCSDPSLEWTVTVTVAAPVTATDDELTVAEDTAGTVDVLRNDRTTPPGETLSVAAVTAPEHGAAVIAGDVVGYTPVENYHGPDSFEYTATTGAASATGTVSVTVTPVNDAPLALDDEATTSGRAVTIDVLDNDEDIDGDSLRIAAVSTPAHGTATIDGSGILYTPGATFADSDSFTYTVSDGDLTDTATVTVTLGDGWRLEAEYVPHTRRILVSWSANTDFAGYELRQSTEILVPVPPNTPTPTIPLTSTLQVGTDTSHVSANPVGNTTYAYAIRGCNGASACGDWSLPVTVEVRQLAEPFADPLALDTTTAPGNLPYETGVTRAGDAYVNVPIVPAPGVAGLAPSLSLDYGGGQSPALSEEPGDSLGHGWRVGGLSKVYRCVTNRAGVSNLTLTHTDALCLDGEPLVRVSGTYLTPGSHYRTLRETFVKLELKGSSTEPSWFEAVFPDGTVRQYGNTADSRLEVAGPQDRRAPLVWSVHRETDALGNAMTYAYNEDEANAVRHPVRIDYGASSDATVRFWYMGREDTETVSIGTLNRRQHLLLNRVEVWLSDKRVREYRLASELEQGRRRLTDIQLCGYDESGVSSQCLDAFGVHWALADGSPRLESVTDPMGRDTRFEYGAITTSGTGDPAFASTERPFGSPSGTVDGTAALVTTDGPSKSIVTAVSRDNGIGGRHRTSYAYQGKGLKSTKHWGVLGFHATRVTDVASGVVSYYQYRHDFPYLAEVSAVRQYDGTYGESGTSILSRRETSYATEDISRTTGSGKFPYIDAQTEFLYEGGTQIGTARTTNVLSFDTSGLPTRAVRTTVVGHGPAPQASPPSGTWGAVHGYTATSPQRTTVTTVDFTNRTTAGRWLIGFPRRNVMDYHEGAGGDTADRRVTTDFTAHGNTLLMGTETRFPGDAEHRLLTEYGYDTRGNVTSAEVSGANVDLRRARASNFIASRYPGTLTNALRHRETLTYDARFGAVKTLTDANGRITRLAYDSFGRETRRTTPDGVAITTAYGDCSSCPRVGFATAVMQVDTSSSIAPDTTRYVDKLGRTIRAETVAFDGGARRTQDIKYDAQGRVHEVSEPYHAGSSKHYTVYAYDIRDRVTAETRADGGSVRTAYTDSGNLVQATRTETVKEGGIAATTQRKVSRYNVLGELVETVDAQGATPTVTTAYTYDASGLLDVVTVDGVRRTDFDHDAAGNRDAVSSPNFGRVTFAHTALGELRTRTDAKHQATRYTYDLLGRLLSATDGGGASRWTYDRTNGKGFLKQRCRAATAIIDCRAVGEYRETFAYGSDARVATRTTEIRADASTTRTYHHTYGYASDGRVRTGPLKSHQASFETPVPLVTTSPQRSSRPHLELPLDSTPMESALMPTVAVLS